MFFENLSKLLHDTDITISVRGGEQQLTVSVVPKSTKKDTKVLLPVMTLSGPPKEIDDSFFQLINEPVKESTELIVKSQELLQATKKAKEEAEKKKNAKAATTTAKKVEPVKEEPKAEEVVPANQPSLFS